LRRSSRKIRVTLDSGIERTSRHVLVVPLPIL
jgi:hypothetical protein